MTKTNGRISLGDYIDVAERIANFNERYPDGSLQTICWTIEEVAGQTFVVYRAAAYRTPDDERPGMGIAWEPFPGKTNFTRDSELMNAETSAWGRAIVACGLTSNRKIASREEVQARQPAEPPSEPPGAPTIINDDRYHRLLDLHRQAGVDQQWLRMRLIALGVENLGHDQGALGRAVRSLSDEQVDALEALYDEAIAARAQAIEERASQRLGA